MRLPFSTQAWSRKLVCSLSVALLIGMFVGWKSVYGSDRSVVLGEGIWSRIREPRPRHRIDRNGSRGNRRESYSPPSQAALAPEPLPRRPEPSMDSAELVQWKFRAIEDGIRQLRAAGSRQQANRFAGELAELNRSLEQPWKSTPSEQPELHVVCVYEGSPKIHVTHTDAPIVLCVWPVP